MNQWSNKFNWKKLIGPCIVILIPIVGYIWSSKRANYVKEYGIWSIMTVDHVSANAGGGTGFKCHYKFRDKIYKNTGGGVDYSDEGKRFFLQIIPTAPERVFYYIESRIPSWFTLEAPPEGWSSRPTEAELRKLQNEADSIQAIKSK